jgi:hypothetical protein
MASSFDLTTLNGVHFNGDNAALSGELVNYYNGTSLSATELGASSQGNGVTLYYINSIVGNNNGGINVSDAQNSYAAGFVSSGKYYLPTFGTMKLSGTGGGYANDTWYVHGFSDGAMLLSTNKYLATYVYHSQSNGDAIVSGLSKPGGFQAVLVLSDNDLGAGPTSPAYAAGGYTDALGIQHSIDHTNGGTLGFGAAPDGNPNPPFSSNGNSFPLTFTGDSSQFTPPCYAEGVRVQTVRGEVTVEDLIEGDEIVTASGQTRPVIWIGSRRVRPMSHPTPAELNPVRVRRGAFGEGLPVRDLILSPGHAVFVDGVLVPVGHLVNGATIVQEEVETVRYFHVELDAHDVLLAEGLPCESYLDDGNREAFANSPEHTALYGPLDPQERENACAPLVRDGEALAAIQARLHARAEEIGWTKSTAHDLTLLADGQAIAPLHAAGNRLWFQVPVAARLALASPAAAPLHLVPGASDTRRLGVAVSELRVDGQVLDLASDALGAGFHPLESHGDLAWRWTDGAADLALAGPALLEVTLHMTAPVWKRAAPQLRLVQAG